MYEQVIRQVIERCYAQFGWPPRKIAVTRLFFQGLRAEMRANSILFDDPNKEVDIVFGGKTRVYATMEHGSNRKLVDHVQAWEVPLIQR